MVIVAHKPNAPYFFIQRSHHSEVLFGSKSKDQLLHLDWSMKVSPEVFKGWQLLDKKWIFLDKNGRFV